METIDVRRPIAYCLFPSQSRFLAVSVDAIEGIIETARLVRLPLCPPPVSALCSYRGGVLPVVCLADECEDRIAERRGSRPTVLVLRTEHGNLGLLIDREDIAIVEDYQVHGTGNLAGDGGEALPLPKGLIGVGSIERHGNSHAIIDPNRTWMALRSVIEQGYQAGLGIEGAAAGSSSSEGMSAGPSAGAR